MSLKEETVSANAAFEQHVERLLSFNARVEHAIDAEISAADRQHRTRAATRVAAREAVRTKLKAAVQQFKETVSANAAFEAAWPLKPRIR